MKKPYFILAFMLLFFINSESQGYLEMIDSGQFTVQEVQNAAQKHFEITGTGRGTGYKNFKRWEYNALRMQDTSGVLKPSSFYYNELERFNSDRNNSSQLNRTTKVANWEELGPKYWDDFEGWNPGVGRITSIAIDSNNENHIIVGSPGGGVWKSTDGGSNWVVLTDNLSNIMVLSLVIDPADSNSYFWGSDAGVIYKSTDAGSTWNQLADLGNGTVNKILIHPTDSNKMFCSVRFSGIYKSVDAGQNWSLIHPNSVTGFDVEFKPGNSNTIYASGDLFFKSIDSGVSFEVINVTKDPLISWSQEYVSGSTDWVGAESNYNGSVTPKSGIKLALLERFSTAHTKTKLISPAIDLSGISDSALKFSFTNVIRFAGIPAEDFKVFYKTGVSDQWILLATITGEVKAWKEVSIDLPDPSGDYYIAFEGHTYYASEITLDDVSIESPTQVVYSDDFEFGADPNSFQNDSKMIGVSAHNPEVVYVLEASDGVFGEFYKSTDSGENFTKLDHNGKNYFGYSSSAGDNQGQAPRDMDIIVNPNDADDVHIAGILSWRSTNGGSSFNVTSQWRPERAANENIGYCHADIDIMIYQNDKIYLGTDGGIFVANDPLNVSSSYYTDLSVGLGIRQFYKIGISQTDPVIVSGGSQDNGTSIYRADGRWKDWLGADGMETFIDHSDPNVLYGTTQGGALWKSNNQGQGYDVLTRPDNKFGNWITPFEQDPSDKSSIYVGYNQVYKSDIAGDTLADGSQSWKPISSVFERNLDHLKIAPSDNQTIYAAFGSNLFKTTSGGGTGSTAWQQLTGFSGSINSIAVHPADPDKLAIATTASEKVYISTDGGLNWQAIRHDLPDFAALALVWDVTYNEDILYLGMNYGIYYLRDSETSWGPYSTSFPNVKVNELEINTADNKIYSATYGRGLWRVDLFNPSTMSVDDSEVFDLKIFPNPTSGSFKIHSEINELVTLKIYDILGKLVFYEKNRNISLNSEIKLEAAKGVYFLKANTVSREMTKKLILK